ncbi:MAG: hypothetical protein K6F53_10640, partial [Lachnospiraceae bacterium]|nr:hypothetical protein [Lachnospiraceae bacterium]
MYRYFFIAKNNIRKQKSDMITFLLMTMITAFLLFISISYMTGIGDVIDSVYKKINGTDLTFIASPDRLTEEKLKGVILENPYCGSYEITKNLTVANAKYGKRPDRKMSEYGFVFISYEQEINIQKISTDTVGLSGDDAVIPVRMSPDYGIGDTMYLKLGDNSYALKVKGYAEDSLYCSPMNIGDYVIYISDDLYEEILFENPSVAKEFAVHKVRLTADAKRKGMKQEEILDHISSEVTDWASGYRMKHPEYEGGIRNSFSYEMLH